jgi:rare lipoprotein A
LLGPTGGRTCDAPDGLVETGESFAGYASWYGWEFGGQPTATGAIFDPRLFTAASRTLPFGAFLRVRYEGRCALVLINDRGPYGRLERVIDLSQAAAEYLGVGVSWVDADVLVPEDGLPG